MPSFKRKRIPENPNTSISKKFKRTGTLTAKVNRLMKSVETKYADSANSPQALAAGTGVVIALISQVAAGDDNTQRNGRKINLLASNLKFHLNITDGTAASPAGQRVVLVYDRQPNGTDPTWLDVFETSSSDAMRKMNNMPRFAVFYDNFMSAHKGYLGQSPDLSPGFVSGMYDTNFKKFPASWITEFAGTGAATPLHGGLYLMALTDTAGAIRYRHRTTFSDI